MNRKSYEFLKRLHSIGLFYDDGLWWLPVFQWLQIGLGTSMWVLESIVSHRSLFWSLWWHSSIFSKMDSFTNMWVSRSEGQILISALGYFFGFNIWHFFFSLWCFHRFHEFWPVSSPPAFHLISTFGLLSFFFQQTNFSKQSTSTYVRMI